MKLLKQFCTLCFLSKIIGFFPPVKAFEQELSFRTFTVLQTKV